MRHVKHCPQWGSGRATPPWGSTRTLQKEQLSVATWRVRTQLNLSIFGAVFFKGKTWAAHKNNWESSFDKPDLPFLSIFKLEKILEKSWLFFFPDLDPEKIIANSFFFFRARLPSQLLGLKVPKLHPAESLQVFRDVLQDPLGHLWFVGIVYDFMFFKI